MNMPARVGAIRSVLTVLFASIVLVSAASADDWPGWRGRNHDGISKETKWNPKALEAGAKIAWKKELGKGYSAPSVRGNLFYVAGNVNDEDIVYCMKTTDGSEVWRYSYPCKAGAHPGPRSTPILDGDSVFFISRETQLFCLNAKTGKVKWQKNLIANFEAENLKWGFSSSPCLTGDILIFNAGARGLALRKDDGSKVWSGPPGKGNYSVPVIYKQGDRTCVVTFGPKTIYGLDAKTGRELWSYPWTSKYNIIASDPVIDGNYVFISSGYDKGSALLDVGGKAPRVVWQNKTLRSHFSTPVLLDGYLYGIDGNAGNGDLVCIKFSTGNEEWRKKMGFGSLISAACKLIVLNEKGKLFIVEASPNSYQEISSAQVLDKPKCWTAPVLSNGLLYCRNDRGTLVCVDLR